VAHRRRPALAALRGEPVPRRTEVEVALVVRGSTAAAPRR